MSLQRFNNYLDGLREEFDFQLKATSTSRPNPRRFNICIGNLKGEFEMMILENESLQKERDELEAKSMHFVLLSSNYLY